MNETEDVNKQATKSVKVWKSIRILNGIRRKLLLLRITHIVMALVNVPEMNISRYKPKVANSRYEASVKVSFVFIASISYMSYYYQLSPLSIESVK